MRILLAAFCLVAFVVTWATMGLVIDLSLMGLSYSGLSQAERVQVGLQKSVSGEWLIAATVFCTLNVLAQYGFRHCVRRIAEEGDPDPTRGFRWMRALQSVVIAWALWYAWIICVGLR